MRCSTDDVALYVEGDLPPSHAAALECHLDACQACRDLASDLRLTQSLLKSVAPPEDLREIAFVQPSARRRLIWTAIPVAAAAALFFLALLRRPAPLPPPPAPVVAVVHTPPLRLAPRPVPHRPRPRPQPLRQPLLVQMQTSDPNVVIYWIIDPQGD